MKYNIRSFYLLLFNIIMGLPLLLSSQGDTLKLVHYPFMYSGQYDYHYYKNAYYEAKEIIEDSSVSWSAKEFHYWKFIRSNMALLVPDSIIKQIWNEAFENSPIGICDFYSFIFTQPFNREYLTKSEVAYYYLHNEKSYFDSMCASLYEKYDANLMKILSQIRKDDNASNKRVINDEQIQKDKINQERVDSIILKLRKYPGRSLVGWPLENSAWLVIQHAPLKYHLKYLPLIEKAVEEKELAPKHLAYSIDRIRMAQDLPQIYGTQFQEVNGKRILYDLEDINAVDQKRKELGLPTLKSYMDGEKIVFK